MVLHEEWQKDFGSRLRAEREKRGLTRNALAEKVDTAPDYIAQLERGDKSPSMQMLINILTALDMSADLLLFGVSSENEMDFILNDLTSFLKRRSVEEVIALCEIIKFMAKYVGNPAQKLK